MKPLRPIAIAACLSLLGAACSGGAGQDEDDPGAAALIVKPAAPEVTSPESPDPSVVIAPSHDDRDALSDPVPAPPGGDRVLSPLADLVESAGDMRFDPDAPRPQSGPAPIGLSIPAIGVDDVGVRDVGVEPNGEMEIPGATEVGWYRWSPPPGHPGSAVLAAHIAFDGRDGVFRDLDDLTVGSRFRVRYDDGSERHFEITERAQYTKDELPLDRVFARDGDATVVLITCGGDFNRARSSYADNVVAYASPV